MVALDDMLQLGPAAVLEDLGPHTAPWTRSSRGQRRQPEPGSLHRLLNSGKHVPFIIGLSTAEDLLLLKPEPKLLPIQFAPD